MALKIQTHPDRGRGGLKIRDFGERSLLTAPDSIRISAVNFLYKIPYRRGGDYV